MVDLAVGTPEVGAVNFSVLHSLLHAMLRHLNIADVRAQLPVEREDVQELDRTVPRAVRQHGTKVDDRREISDMESDSGITGLTSASEACTELYPDQLGSKQDSEKPIPITRRPYHQLEERVGRMERQLTDLNSLPSTKELMESSGDEKSRGRPVADMWQGMQLSRKVDANTQGVSKVRTYTASLVHVYCTTVELTNEQYFA